MRRWPALGLLLVALWLAAPAAAQTELVAGYPDRAARGPAAAKGAVVYSHGLARVSESTTDTPFVIDELQEAGWDVFRLERRWAGDTLEGSTAALAATAQRLRQEGYARIVLVGQSFGGWISLAAARPDAGPIHAVIAFAPAAFGTPGDSSTWTRNAEQLYPLAENVAAQRVLIFLFDGDEYDPGGRGGKLGEIFARRDLPAAVVDRPFGLAGHGVALSRGFARRFGACIRDFVETSSPAPRFVCGGEALPTLAGFSLPDDLRVKPAPPEAEPGLAAMLGRWYGVYDNGREVLFVVEEVGKDRARAVYAFGPLARRPEDRAGYTRRRGEFETSTGTLRFTEPHAANDLECRLDGDGRLLLNWISRQSGVRLATRLRKVE
jgi:pimeloyl-ACP methyl ester carboxylesterase